MRTRSGAPEKGDHVSADYRDNSSHSSFSPRTSSSSTASTRSGRRRSSSPTTMSQAMSAGSPASPDKPLAIRATRKRAATSTGSVGKAPGGKEVASTGDAALTDGKTSELHSRQSSGESAVAAAGHVCLCQPDPKIPRPRNAFILYRQHHQASVAAQNPRLANPQISTIIGEQWRNETPQVKGEWKVLAEEEKLRHQQQYPDYRYQPRRNGRRGSVDATTAQSAEKYRCAKCGGRSIISPSTPLSAGIPQPLLPPPTSSASTPTTATTPNSRYLPMLNNLTLSSPQSRRNVVGGPPPSVTGSSSLQIAPPREAYPEGDLFSPLSPNSKRRRFERGGGPYASVPNTARPGNGTPYPFSSQERRGSLPRPDQLLRAPSPNSVMMMSPPVPQRGPHSNQGGYHQPYPSRSAYDPNLTLPPLQLGASVPADANLTAIVKSMPYLNKILVLGRVAPPAKQPTPGSGRRGAIIAIEGEDSAAAQELAGWLETFLAGEGAFAPRLLPGPREPKETSSPEKVDGAGGLREYLSVVGEWHGKNREMFDFLAGGLSSPPSIEDAASSRMHSDPVPRNEADRAGDADMKDAAPSAPSSVPSPLQPPSSSSPPQRHDQVPHVIPTLLIPSYHLHATDAYTAAIPIEDAYSATDHWQWMATLWRGTAGPDLTIYLRDHQVDSAENQQQQQQQQQQRGTVEVCEGYRTLVVRREVRNGTPVVSGGGAVAGLAEGALRRVGFEVGEWVRGVAGRGEGR